MEIDFVRDESESDEDPHWVSRTVRCGFLGKEDLRRDLQNRPRGKKKRLLRKNDIDGWR